MKKSENLKPVAIYLEDLKFFLQPVVGILNENYKLVRTDQVFLVPFWGCIKENQSLPKGGIRIPRSYWECELLPKLEKGGVHRARNSWPIRLAKSEDVDFQGKTLAQCVCCKAVSVLDQGEGDLKPKQSYPIPWKPRICYSCRFAVENALEESVDAVESKSPPQSGMTTESFEQEEGGVYCRMCRKAHPDDGYNSFVRGKKSLGTEGVCSQSANEMVDILGRMEPTHLVQVLREIAQKAVSHENRDWWSSERSNTSSIGELRGAFGKIRRVEFKLR